MFVFIGDVGFAAEWNAVERTRCKLHFAGEFFLRQYAGQVDVAVDAALRKLRIDTRRVEGFADDVQLQFAVFEEFERAFGVEFAAVLRNQADFVELERALAELFVGLEKQHAVCTCKSAVEIPVDDGGGGFAFDVDTAVQTACDVLTDKVVRTGIVDAQCEFELVLGSIDRAGYIDAAVFE